MVTRINRTGCSTAPSACCARVLLHELGLHNCFLTHAACCCAQIAFVGFVFAALVTRQGPIEALFSHLSDPLGNNIVTNIGKLPSVLSYPTVAAPVPEP